MSCGCPVITSSTTAIPEVAEDAAQYVDPTSREQMASAIRRLINDKDLRAQLSARGLLRSRYFSWTRTFGDIEVFLREQGAEGLAFPPIVAAGEHGARVVARGSSLTTGRPFNLIVAFERTRDVDGNLLGRGVAESSFHHFADYNWDTSRGAPAFVTEPEGKGMTTEPRALSDTRQYVRNLAFWLAPQR